MDEDIDIEEHDLLDNPRIRDIFPDLSRVKIEIPDSDVEPEYEQTYDEYTDAQADGYEYEDYLEFDNIESAENFHYNTHIDMQETGSDLPPEDIYHSNNKIILGTKPNTDIDELEGSFVDTISDNVRKEHLPALVLLEDWGNRLITSPCYCKECEILFATINALDAHKMCAHSFLVAIDTDKALKNTNKHAIAQYSNEPAQIAGLKKPIQNNVAKKSTAKSANNKYCNHCNTYFADGTALIKHLYELLPPKKPKADVSIKKSVSGKCNFKCVVCNAVFQLYSAARMHRHQFHPEHRGLHAICKIDPSGKRIVVKKGKINVPKISGEPKKVTTLDKIKKFNKVKSLKEESITGYRYTDCPDIMNPPVPKSILFNCPLCSIHFVSLYPACHHTKQCSRMSKYRLCKICNRKIRERDVYTHELQHKFTKKFNVHEIDWDLIKRVLCKCPKCGVHCSTMKFWRHWQTGCDVPKSKCKVCDIDVIQECKTTHSRNHAVMSYTREDILIVEFNWSEGYKRKLDDLAPHPEAKKAKPDVGVTKNVVSSSKINTKKLILNYCEKCNCCVHVYAWKYHLPKCRKNEKKVCQQCGLVFAKSSAAKHRKLHDARKVTLHDFKFISKDLKEIAPPPPDYFACKKCHVQRLSARGEHDCSEKHHTCVICDKKYNLSAYKLHTQFHTYEKKNFIAEPKYDVLNEMWNILFQCKECYMNTDSYDKSVAHSQDHLNKAKWCGVSTQKCNICDLLFDESRVSAHKELHKKLPINRKDFLLLHYDPTKLLSEDWFELFGALPEQKVKQIVASSIYRHTRQIKLRVVQNGRPESTVFKCKICNYCVNPNDLVQHVHATKDSKDKGHPCTKCQLSFFSVDALKIHLADHNKNEGDYSVRIVEFNYTRTNKSDEIIKEMISDPIKTTTLHKCYRCKVGFTTSTSAHQHKCKSDKKKYCGICRVMYLQKRKRNHQIFHERFPQLRAENIKIVIFKRSNKKTVDTKERKKVVKASKVPVTLRDDDVVKVYRCPCGLHFTSMKTMEKHIELSTPGYTVSNENCSQCGLLFDTDSLVNHLCMHHRKNTKIRIEHVKVLQFYECTDCNLLFNDTCELSNHYDDCYTSCGVKCNVCDFTFHYLAVKAHACKPTPGNTGIVLNKVVKVNKHDAIQENEHVLYRCDTCDVHLLSARSLRLHSSGGHNSRIIETCKHCGLKFSGVSFCHHMKRDHSSWSFLIKVCDVATNKNYSITEHSKPSEYETTNVTLAKDDVPLQIKVCDVPTSKKDIITEHTEPVDDETTNITLATETVTKTKTTKSHVLYRCSLCDLQHMKDNSWRNHVKKNHRPWTTAACKLCGLQFPIRTLEPHMRRDHKKDTFRLTVIEPDTRNTFVVTKYAELNKTASGDDTNGVDVDPLDVEEPSEDAVSETKDATLSHVALTDDTLNTTVNTEACDMELQNGAESPPNDEINITESTVYRCNVCDIHHIMMKSYYTHAVYKKHSFFKPAYKCDHCGLRFIETSLTKHVQQSHKRKYFRITVCDVKASTTEIVTNLTNPNADNDTREADVVESSDVSIAMETEHNEDLHDGLGTPSVDDQSLDGRSATKSELKFKTSTYSNSSLDSTEFAGFCSDKAANLDAVQPASCSTSSVEYKVKLYKCSPCNVYYLTLPLYKKHIQEHVPLNDVDYIECKKCNLQFATAQIHIHMQKHHKTYFNLNEVLIEENQLNGQGITSKMYMYHVKDKIQSRMVSSTKAEAKN